MSVPMKRLLAIILFSVGFLPVLRAQFQDPTVIVDPHTHTLQQAAPFDQEFYLLLPVDPTLQADEVEELQVKRVTGKKNNLQFTTIQEYKEGEFHELSITDSPKVEGYKFLRVHIVKQLLPNTRFVIVLIIKPSHAYLKELNKINYEIITGELGQARKDYDEVAGKLYVQHSETPLGWPDFDRYKTRFIDSARPAYQNIIQEDSSLYRLLTQLKDTLDSAGVLIPNLFRYEYEKDFIAQRILTDSTKLLIPLHNLLYVPSALPYFGTGRLNIRELRLYDPALEVDAQKRIDNLTNLDSALYQIGYFCQFTYFSKAIPKKAQNNIDSLVQAGEMMIRNRVKSLTDDGKGIRNAINKIPGIASAEASYGGTLPMGEDLQTSSGHYFIPDLGLASAGTFVGRQFGYVVRPYLGVNISFVAINKNLPISSIQNKKLLHRLSAVVGLTTTALSRQGTYDLIGSMSVVTGLAYRFSRAFRVTSGCLIYKRDARDPLLPAQVTIGPMVALSLDMDVAHWFSDLKSKLY